MNIDTDIRGAPAFYITYGFLAMVVLGILFGVTSFKFGWPVAPNAAIGLSILMVSCFGGIGHAFYVRRREAIKRLGPRFGNETHMSKDK